MFLLHFVFELVDVLRPFSCVRVKEVKRVEYAGLVQLVWLHVAHAFVDLHISEGLTVNQSLECEAWRPRVTLLACCYGGNLQDVPQYEKVESVY